MMDRKTAAGGAGVLDLFLVRAGDGLFALPMDQVDAVGAWPAAGAMAAVELERVAAPASGATSVRAFQFRDAAGRACALGVARPPQQVRLAADAASGVPRALGRLGAPRWIAGFVEWEGAIAVLVDLPALAAVHAGPGPGEAAPR